MGKTSQLAIPIPMLLHIIHPSMQKSLLPLLSTRKGRSRKKGFQTQLPPPFSRRRRRRILFRISQTVENGEMRRETTSTTFFPVCVGDPRVAHLGLHDGRWRRGKFKTSGAQKKRKWLNRDFFWSFFFFKRGRIFLCSTTPDICEVHFPISSA